MKRSSLLTSAVLSFVLFGATGALAATLYVDLNSANPQSPFAGWGTAARSIQDAVDAAAASDTILVTNGIYASGGRTMSDTTTNRLAINKVVTVVSVNGPQFTMIQGYQVPGTTNGNAAIRCVSLAAGASLSGFTLANGATRTGTIYGGGARAASTDSIISNCWIVGNAAAGYGGGAYSATLVDCVVSNNWAAIGGGTCNAILTNCTLSGNAATNYGGGAYVGTLNNCLVTRNSAPSGGGVRSSVLNQCTITGNAASGSGGGAYAGTLNNCMVTSNSAASGGGAYAGTLNNCMVTSNSAASGGGAYGSTLNDCAVTGNAASGSGGGTYSSTLNNCTLTGNSATSGGGAYLGGLNNSILYFNRAGTGTNYSASSVLNYCCTTPLPASGVGNLSSDPQLGSGSHLSAASPCRGAGSAAYATGTDIDGELWANPPSIGCDEYVAGAVTGPLAVAWSADRRAVTPRYEVSFTPSVQGRVSAIAWDFGDGVVVSNQPYASYAWSVPGDYAVVLWAYNESYPEGVGATGVVRVAVQPILYVAADSPNPVSPYLSWATAATSIQDAVDATGPGALILVSNGVYAAGGRAVNGTSNRVAVTAAMVLQSVNGPGVTSIVGYQVPGTANGAQAVRCVYLANGATLAGFTLTRGATLSSGGGVWCESASAVVSNCVIVGNSASGSGGGVFSGNLMDCTITANSASFDGGGAVGGTLNNCALSGNSATQGGGASSCTLNNCTLTGNTAMGWTNVSGGGVSYCTLNNSIIYLNQVFSYPSDPTANYDYGTVLNYCCTTPQPSAGTGNITSDPQLASLSHLSVTSPCRAAGSAAYATGTDIDGEAWLNPPSIGCDEYRAGAVTGPLSVNIAATATNLLPGVPVALTALIDGRTTASAWDFGGGVVMSNQPYASRVWTTPGDYAVVLRAYNESNPAGVSATVIFHVRTAFGVFPSDAPPYGKTYAEWSAAWWQWNFSLPMTNSPVQDTAPISAGQSGPVWFLAGTFGLSGNQSRVRSGSVPEDTAFFVPLGESWADNAGCPPTTYTTSELRAQAASYQNQFLVMSCTIDGQPTVDLSAPNTTPYRVQSPVFTYTMPAVHNYAYDLFGATCYSNRIGAPYTVSGAVADGVYLIAAPLAPGPHTIHFSATYPSYPAPVVQDITYNLTVVPTPVLAVSHQDANLVLSWPQAASWYVLEATTSLSSPNWVAAGAEVHQAGGQFQATIPIGSGSQFFRLRRN